MGMGSWYRKLLFSLCIMLCAATVPAYATSPESQMIIIRNTDGTESLIPIQGDAIHDMQFAYHAEMKEIEIPEGITIIKGEAFFGCSNLQSVVLPNSLKVIEIMAFQQCTQLREIALPEGLIAIGSDAFAETALVNVSIPSSVQWIGEEAFISPNLEQIDIHASFIEYYAPTFFYSARKFLLRIPSMEFLEQLIDEVLDRHSTDVTIMEEPNWVEEPGSYE